MKILNNKKIVIFIVSVLIIAGSIFGICKYNQYNEKNKYDKIKKSIENIFFYLPEKEYTDLNLIPDYCKISMVFGTKYLNYSKYISSKDYITPVKKKDKDSVGVYATEDIENAVKKIIGKDATIKYNKDSEGDYEFTIENGCGYNNSSLDLLRYNDQEKYIFSSKITEEDSNSKIYVKWLEPEKSKDGIILKAYAFEVVKNDDDSYTLYADSNRNFVADVVANKETLDKKIDELYKTKSRLYQFVIKKSGKDYKWVSYKIIDNIYELPVYE